MIIRIGSKPSRVRYVVVAAAVVVVAIVVVLIARQSSGEVSIKADQYVDFDRQPPVVTDANPSDPIPDTVDLRIGPDSLYPFNNAKNWFKGSGSCAAGVGQALEGELKLTAKTVDVCLYTSGHRFYTLRVSTDRAGHRIEFSRDR